MIFRVKGRSFWQGNNFQGRSVMPLPFGRQIFSAVLALLRARYPRVLMPAHRASLTGHRILAVTNITGQHLIGRNLNFANYLHAGSSSEHFARFSESMEKANAHCSQKIGML